MKSEWKNGVAFGMTAQDDNNELVEVFITDELIRSGRLIIVNAVWFLEYDNGQRVELAAIPKWRFT
jgi:hypothetical protein